MFTDRLIFEIKKMNKWLVDSNYKALEEAYSDLIKVDIEHIKEEISDYPFKLIPIQTMMP